MQKAEKIATKKAPAVENTPEAAPKKIRKVPSNETVLRYFDELIAMIAEELKRLKDSSAKNNGSKFLRGINRHVKLLRGQTERVFKREVKTRRTNIATGIQQPVKISRELAKFCQWPEDELRSRIDVTKYICNYIAEQNLQNPVSRREIIPDSKLQKLLGYNPRSATKPLKYCTIQSCLKERGHFAKKDG